MSHTPQQQQSMLQLARQSIEHGLAHGSPATIELQQCDPFLQQPGACFVTLEINQQLRGCIGSLEARRPLAQDLLENGYAAAFRDPRFPSLAQQEYPSTTIKLSLLPPAEPMQFNSEAELIRQLLPGMDGLILQEGHRRGTFLPSVWEQLPDPQLFLNQLKQKAGLPADYWSDTLTIERYHTEQFS